MVNIFGVKLYWVKRLILQPSPSMLNKLTLKKIYKMLKNNNKLIEFNLLYCNFVFINKIMNNYSHKKL